MLSAAVERQFEIIGEALSRVRRVAPELSAQIPDVSDIIGFRNTLAASILSRFGARLKTICRT